MRRIANTWALMKSSWHLLMRDKALLILPLISGVAGLLVLVAFVLPFISTIASGWTKDGDPKFATYVIIFGYYLANFFVIYFFNAALVDYVVTRLRGDEPSLRASLRIAAGCARQIALWAMAAATVGVVLQAFQSRTGILGRLAASFFGVAWTLVTYFVVPLIVIERKGALESIAKSTDMVTETWGEQAASSLGYGLIGFLLCIPAFFVGVLAIIALGTSGVGVVTPYLLVVLGGIMWVVGVGVVMTALKAIFGVVLYLYTKTGKVPEGFSVRSLRSAIATA